ncbi:hypothetical protein K504DRAFT_7613 [Pleomassaria siparia CBS 279.74]|uniref:Uncharacterized protein n=1 Tax=Pleomassaria siparia CBS 279.74 TaxID=1314801 RepID=A0A6G1KQQ3_9PLEO|nr:hypothetical protein K504DRAFT_7613 [Pleomassaria siparia CBS 279.74]
MYVCMYHQIYVLPAGRPSLITCDMVACLRARTRTRADMGAGSRLIHAYSCLPVFLTPFTYAIACLSIYMGNKTEQAVYVCKLMYLYVQVIMTRAKRFSEFMQMYACA